MCKPIRIGRNCTRMPVVGFDCTGTYQPNPNVSATDWETWKSLLTVIATDVSSVTYSEHLRGATSELTPVYRQE